MNTLSGSGGVGWDCENGFVGGWSLTSGMIAVKYQDMKHEERQPRVLFTFHVFMFHVSGQTLPMRFRIRAPERLANFLHGVLRQRALVGDLDVSPRVLRLGRADDGGVRARLRERE